MIEIENTEAATTHRRPFTCTVITQPAGVYNDGVLEGVRVANWLMVGELIVDGVDH